jgi:hypothetical protein
LNLPGWRTKRKIIVIESDDWGTVRLSSKIAYNDFLKKRYPVDECPYNRNDSLECNSDMELLFDVLSSVKDQRDNPALLTVNNIVANPDFGKIRSADFQQYFYEPFTETLKRYPNHDKVEKLYLEGIEKKMLMPQFHGREHVNVERWLKALRERNESSLFAFDHSMFSVHTRPPVGGSYELMDALNGDSSESLEKKEEILIEGLELFESIWGFRSMSFIAPCYIWQTALENILFGNGVGIIQGMVNQLEPTPREGFDYKKKYHYQGQVNKLGQVYLVRNAFFEPSAQPDFDWVGDCMNRIRVAFRWHKPAIISTHRVNFIGFIREENRTANLALFKQLLTKIVQTWPEVEFMSSVKLGETIKGI